jgi:hypothetical protein
MGSIHAVREILPVRQNDGPEARRRGRVKRALRRRHCLPVLVALIGSLAIASLGWTSVASARPYNWEPGPTPTEGDPTGDDLPNPTPKPKNLASSIHSGDRTGVSDGAAAVGGVVSWQWFVRYLSLFPLR